MTDGGAVQDVVVGIAGLLAAGLLLREDRRVARWFEATGHDRSAPEPGSDDHGSDELARMQKYWRARWPARVLAIGLAICGIYLLISALVS